MQNAGEYLCIMITAEWHALLRISNSLFHVRYVRQTTVV